jgi:hypothetical protein
MVPTFTLKPIDGVGAQLCPCGFATSTPQAFLVASRPATSTGQGVPHTEVQVRAAAQPIRQVAAGGSLFRGVHTLVHCRYTFPSCSPDTGPSDSADPSRLCQGCLPPDTLIPGAGLPSASPACCDRLEE